MGRFRRRWLSLGPDIRFLIFATVGGIVGAVLIWGEGIRNGKSQAPSVVMTVLVIGFLIYLWRATYHRVRGRGISRVRQPGSDQTEPGGTNPTAGPYRDRPPDWRD